jgi:arylsulfatase A-like enzyme
LLADALILLRHYSLSQLYLVTHERSVTIHFHSFYLSHNYSHIERSEISHRLQRIYLLDFFSQSIMTEQQRQPNFLVIVADDLGWSDLGSFGSEIHTPNLDMLALSNGLRFTDFHTASACSPTRAMLLSGTDNHIAGLGQMNEFLFSHGDLWTNSLGYEGYLNMRVAALSEILQDAGYRTLLSGKWHLGLKANQTPYARGFQRSFSLLNAFGNHYNKEPKGDDGGSPINLFEHSYVEDEHFVSSDSLPSNFYSTDYFTEQLIRFLQEPPEKDRPFFAYLAYSAPHWPLQAPFELIEKYKGIYDDGPDTLRLRRLSRQVSLGLMSSDTIPHPIEAFPGAKLWKDKTAEEKAWSARTMEVYAAMVERMDWNIGRVIDYLKSTGQFDNTVIIFLSDNGAEGAILEAMPIKGKLVREAIQRHYDNSLKNIGNPDSFVWYGPYWAQAATAPSRMSKRYITEGGIRCPLIFHYLPLTKRIKQGTITHEFTTVMDILPTILEIAGIDHPGTHFRGRTVVLPRGRSWLSHLSSLNSHTSVTPIHVHPEGSFTGWELFNQCAIRRGSYKAILIHPPQGTGRWELYDLSDDKGEIQNLAAEKPEILLELIELWTKYMAETGVVLVPDNEIEKRCMNHF